MWPIYNTRWKKKTERVRVKQMHERTHARTRAHARTHARTHAHTHTRARNYSYLARLLQWTVLVNKYTQ